MKKKSRQSGSITLEAVVAFTLSMLLMFLLIGTIMTVYYKERVSEIVFEVSSDVQLMALPFYDSQEVLRNELSEGLLEIIVINLVNEKLKKQGLDRLIRINNVESVLGSQLETGGTFLFDCNYELLIPTVFKNHQVCYPMIGVVHNDGVLYESKTVFITKTGEKYHLSTCFHLRKSKIPMDVDLALKKGYTACKNCILRNKLKARE